MAADPRDFHLPAGPTPAPISSKPWIFWRGCVASERWPFLVSDFLTEDFDRQTTLRIRSAARKHELVSVLVTDPGEFHLPEGGIVALRDLESGTLRYLDAGDRKTREKFLASRQAVHDRILQTHKSIDLDCIEMPTDGDAADNLVRYFRYRERRRR